MDMLSKDRSPHAAFDAGALSNDDTLHHCVDPDAYMHSPDLAVHCSVNPNVMRRNEIASHSRAFSNYACRHSTFGFGSFATLIEVFSELRPLGKQGQFSRHQ